MPSVYYNTQKNRGYIQSNIYLRLCLVFPIEIEGNGVDTMTFVSYGCLYIIRCLRAIERNKLTRRIKPFTFENVPKMSSTSCTGDFDSGHKHRFIFVPVDSTRYGCQMLCSHSKYFLFDKMSVNIPSKNAGHPHPELNFVVLL